MSGDELDRTIEFALQSAARANAQHEQNMLEHAAFQNQLRELGENVTIMTATLTKTLTAMNERDKRQDRRIASLDRQQKNLPQINAENRR